MHLAPKQAGFEVYDSSLSEYGVMGFEFGYSLGDLSPSRFGKPSSATSSTAPRS